MLLLEARLWDSFNLIVGIRCDAHIIKNAYILDNKTYLSKTIQVFCKEGYVFNDRNNHFISCIFNENANQTEWAGVNSIRCDPNSCNRHPDFDLVGLNNSRDIFDFGDIIKYKCPNGYKIRTICIKDGTTGIGEWDFQGSCRGSLINTIIWSHFHFLLRDFTWGNLVAQGPIEIIGV